MFDRNTLELLRSLEAKCGDGYFYKSYKDICIAVKIALSNIKGSGIKLRPTLVRLADSSDKIVAAKVLKFMRREVGSIANGERIKLAAARYVYKRISTLV